MPLHLIHGPPNSGRAGLVRERFEAALARDPVLVVPTLDDVAWFERELAGAGAILGATTTTLAGLFRLVAAADGVPAPAELTPAQRRRAIALAVGRHRPELGPLRRSSGRPGFALAFGRLLDELQAAGLGPADVEAGAGTLESSAYLTDVATLFAGYETVREGLGLLDAQGVARQAIALLRESPSAWERPVFIYGLDDLTANQLDLLAALAATAEVTMAVPYEDGNAAIAARTAPLLERLRGIHLASETPTEPDPPTPTTPSSSTSSGASAGRARSGSLPAGVSSSCARRGSAARPRRSAPRWRDCAPPAPSRMRSRSHCGPRSGAVRRSRRCWSPTGCRSRSRQRSS